ncbi:MAG: Nicotinate-nucleotide adenylyltransferase [uncultured Acidimicrobiales bacterium]|uniref:Probable nicotinate-nucleotide adenylyltransferase n=1 Tax=uncultured Acidimicrobiales bacterium TaxID=310071 RepID=A0A6J4JB86_9ACTN|nr:MAG: Nicotinate-nucleotide adenylyltransferase [uncultured Acidimicrobiales bacterium]
MSRRALGVFGGTFDPVHVGHLVAAVNVRHALDLDLVLLVVANRPWQKEGSRAVTPAADRLAVVRAAVGEVPGVEASDLEVARSGVSYTADTLAALHAEDPETDLVLVIGADVAASLHTWDRVDEVRARSRLAIVNRPGAPRPAVPEGWRADVVEIPALEVSSTDLRARVVDGRPLDYLVPAAAVREVRRRGLYASDRMDERLPEGPQA